MQKPAAPAARKYDLLNNYSVVIAQPIGQVKDETAVLFGPRGAVLWAGKLAALKGAVLGTTH